MKMKLKNSPGAKKKVIGLVLASVFTITAAPDAKAYGCPTYDDQGTVSALTVTELALKGLWRSLFNGLSKMLLGYDRKELASLKVLAAQISMAARAEINAKEALAKGYMSALGLLESAKEQKRVFEKYSPQTGQGVDPCRQLTVHQLVVIAEIKARELARSWAAKGPNSSGRWGDPAGFNRAQQALRRQYFATKDEEALGLGKASTDTVKTATGQNFPLAGADTNGQVLFADTADERVSIAKQAFINNIIGAPVSPIANPQGTTPAARQYFVLKNRRDALVSAVSHSLTTIAAENTPDKSTGKSKAQAMRDVRDLYYGPNAAARWTAWMTQDIHGLRQDRMRLDAAALSNKYEQFKVGQRTELLLGLQVVNEALALQGEMNLKARELQESSLRVPLR